MIGETRSGSSFRGLTHYLLHGAGEDKKLPAWVELRNLLTAEPGQAWEEMQATAGQNGRVKEPVLHVVLSPAPGDELGKDDWLTIADRVLRELGLEEHQVLLATRRELREAFEAVHSWTDLAARLQVHGVHLVARGRGMVLTDGESYVKPSRLGQASSRGRLEARFGQPFWRGRGSSGSSRRRPGPIRATPPGRPTTGGPGHRSGPCAAPAGASAGAPWAVSTPWPPRPPLSPSPSVGGPGSSTGSTGGHPAHAWSRSRTGAMKLGKGRTTTWSATWSVSRQERGSPPWRRESGRWPRTSRSKQGRGRRLTWTRPGSAVSL